MTKLNALAVTRIAEPGRHGDGGGLYLLVGPTGAKSWVFRYKLAKAERQMGLGPFPAVSLAEARFKAEGCRRQRANGIDPLAARAAERAREHHAATLAVSFQRCCETYIASHEGSWKNPKHRQQWPNTLTSYVYPFIGSLPASAIGIAEVRRVLEQPVAASKRSPAGPLWQTRPETANRVRGRIETVLDWARAAGYREGENPARWRGNLSYLLPARPKERRHHAALPYALVPDFIAELRKRPCVTAFAFEYLILNACRTSEGLGARWDELDANINAWVVPKERMKAGLEHRTPLSFAALDVIERARKYSTDSEFIFPSNRLSKPLSNMALLAMLRRMKRGEIPMTVHGFRSTFKDWAMEQTQFARELSEIALAHKVGDDTELAYRRTGVLEKRRALMDAWARYCLGETGAVSLLRPAA